jgi:hypothetical protein
VHADTSTIYSHEPSKEHNEAWEDLLARKYYRRTFFGYILILKAMHMSATKHELEESHDDPDDRLILVKTVPGGVGQGRWTNGDYLATLGVYHELHCLVSIFDIDVVIMTNKLTQFSQRRIYWHFYPDIYFVNMTSELMEQERGHASK